MPPNDRADLKGSIWRRYRLGAMGVFAFVAIACFIYVPTLRYDMIFDDLPSIIDNESIHSLTPLFGTEESYGLLKPKPRTPVSARPVVSLTLALNYHFSQEDPFGYRLTHLTLHIITALVLWSIIATTLGQSIFKGRFDEHRHSLACTASILWMVHPTHTDTVVYLTQRTELLMGLCYALTVYVAIRFWASKTWAARIAWCVVAFATSTCGMLSKEMMASVPAMVLVYEWTFIGGSLIAMLKRSWLLHLALVLSWIPLALIYIAGYNTPLGGFNNTISAGDFWLTQSNSFFVYWRLLFKPWPLLLHYHVPTLTSLSQAWPGVLGMVVYAVVTIYFLWRRTVTGFALLWFFAVLSPTLIVPLPHEEISERRMYVPTLAMLPYLSITAFAVLQTWMNRSSMTDKNATQSITAHLGGHTPAVVGMIVFTAVSVITVPRLSNKLTIWSEVLKHDPNNTFAIAGQGCIEFNEGEIESGLDKMQLAFESDPGYPFFRHALLNSLKSVEKNDRLLSCCQVMCEHCPDDPVCTYNLGLAYEKNGMIDDAIREYKKVCELHPKNWEAHSSAGTLLAERNQLAEAIDHFESATEIKPDFMNCMNLMGLYLSTRQNKKAMYTTRMLLEAARNEDKPPEVIQRIEQSLKQLEKQQQRRESRL